MGNLARLDNLPPVLFSREEYVELLGLLRDALPHVRARYWNHAAKEVAKRIVKVLEN